jgi:2-hydroxycyclohexanecarboxyl-CoA dehydrogenase
VTGGAKGIGAGIANRLANDGFGVAILDFDVEGAERTAKELPSGSAHPCDVSSYESVAEAVRGVLDRWERVDVLVNNAGWDRVQPFLDNEPEQWNRLIAINLKGLINLCHVVLPHMVERGTDRVINVASDAGRVGSSGEAVYSACKGGLIALTKSVAREMAPHGITANCVCPGPTETTLLVEIRSEETGDKIIEAIVRATPVRRLAKAEDIAAAVAFFASPDAAFVTGQVMSVSGGLTMSG